MEGMCYRLRLKFRPKKCAMRCHDGVDRISQLPDCIIVDILSFLSLKEAASTSVLSSRWLDLWKHTPNLNFDAKSCVDMIALLHGSGRNYIEWVNSVLESHKAPSLKEFTISILVNESTQRAVTKWLEFAFSRRVERFELNFLFDHGMHTSVLEGILRESSIYRAQTRTLAVFKSLKELSLKCFKTSGEAIDLFLRSCPLLERLIIDRAILTSDLEVRGMFKHLDITCRGSVGKSIKISAPNLTWLRVNHKLELVLLENVPKLVEADVTCIGQDTIQHFALALSCCISQLEILTITLYFPKVFLASGFPEIPKLKKLVVKYFDARPKGLLPVTPLICASPYLQEFQLKLANCRVEQGMELVPNVERFPHHHLKVFVFSGFDAHAGGDHMELVSYILDNCVALEKIIIRPQLHQLSYYPVRPELITEAATAWYHAKQQLQHIVPHHIQLLF